MIKATVDARHEVASRGGFTWRLILSCGHIQERAASKNGEFVRKVTCWKGHEPVRHGPFEGGQNIG